MTVQSAAEPKVVTPRMLRTIAATVGVRLPGERATMLAPQAEQHFAQLRDLDAIANPSTEPAAELRLDRWSMTGSD
jgi:hypothetical protein